MTSSVSFCHTGLRFDIPTFRLWSAFLRHSLWPNKRKILHCQRHTLWYRAPTSRHCFWGNWSSRFQCDGCVWGSAVSTLWICSWGHGELGAAENLFQWTEYVKSFVISHIHFNVLFHGRVFLCLFTDFVFCAFNFTGQLHRYWICQRIWLVIVRPNAMGFWHCLHGPVRCSSSPRMADVECSCLYKFSP